MRLVLDTNVVFSALLWRGKPYALLQALRQLSGFQLFSSPVLVAELADVLSRPSATKQLALIERQARDVLADYVLAVDLVEPATVPRVVPTDADDDHVIAAAVAAQADLIVSGDSDLLNLANHQGIRIVTAAQALVITQQGP